MLRRTDTSRPSSAIFLSSAKDIALLNCKFSRNCHVFSVANLLRMTGWQALDGVADTFPAVLAACAVLCPGSPGLWRLHRLPELRGPLGGGAAVPWPVLVLLLFLVSALRHFQNVLCILTTAADDGPRYSVLPRR